jgi:hypothetical protein
VNQQLYFQTAYWLGWRQTSLAEISHAFPQSIQADAGITTAASFHVLSNSLFTNHPIILHTAFRASGLVVKRTITTKCGLQLDYTSVVCSVLPFELSGFVRWRKLKWMWTRVIAHTCELCAAQGLYAQLVAPTVWRLVLRYCDGSSGNIVIATQRSRWGRRETGKWSLGAGPEDVSLNYEHFPRLSVTDRALWSRPSGLTLEAGDFVRSWDWMRYTTLR